MTGTIERSRVHPGRYLPAITTALTCGLATIACAEVRVEGDPQSVRVTTDQEVVSDVLSAFAVPFNVKYRTAIPLDTAADATYAGSLGQVISRLLNGYNYIVKRDQQATEIVVYGRRGEVTIQPKAPPLQNGVLSRWR